jgi:hypothetical protein
MQRIVRKITAEETSSLQESKATTSTKERNRARSRAIQRKLVFLLNTMQVKSGSELVFPILFDTQMLGNQYEIALRQSFVSLARGVQGQPPEN